MDFLETGKLKIARLYFNTNKIEHAASFIHILSADVITRTWFCIRVSLNSKMSLSIFVHSSTSQCVELLPQSTVL